MSLIIKGMKLPENDGMKELVIGRAPNGSEPIALVHGDMTEFYKVIELPTPHGRLIDADALYNKFKSEYCNRNCSNSVRGKICDHCGVPRALNIILNAPTIIEAEVYE